MPHDAWWLATFYGTDPRRPFDVYVDIATPAVWHGDGLVRAVDLDLDVIRGTTGRVWVDDEDEFADAPRRLGYPTEVVEACPRGLPSGCSPTSPEEPLPSTGRMPHGSHDCESRDRLDLDRI